MQWSSVSKDDLVITLLSSLSEPYQFLITALDSRADSLKWELVTTRVLHEDMKRKEQGGRVDAPTHVKVKRSFRVIKDSAKKFVKVWRRQTAHVITVVSTDIGSPSVQCGSARMGRDRGHKERISQVKMNLAIFCFCLVARQVLPRRAVGDLLNRWKRST